MPRRFLRGEAIDGRLWDGRWRRGELLAQVGIAADVADGVDRCRSPFESGAAGERFGPMAALGGLVRGFSTISSTVWRAGDRRRSAGRAVRRGIDTRGLWSAVVELGGGRRRGPDRVDPAVGREP